jgi:transcriptional regulator with XRE-family HTH domain
MIVTQTDLSGRSTIIPGYQITSTAQNWQFAEVSFNNVLPLGGTHSLLRAISWLSDSTGDGGAVLTCELLIAWKISLEVDHIRRILPQVHLSSEVITKTPGYSLFPVNISRTLPPHLEAIQWIKTATNLSQERIGRLIGVTRQTINRWEKGEPITDPNRLRLFAVRDVLKRAASRHPAPEQLIGWLDTPQGAEGRTPAQLLEENNIDRARLLAMSAPSPHVVRPPAWVKRPVPKAFQTGAERRQEALPPDADDELSALIENDEDEI